MIEWEYYITKQGVIVMPIGELENHVTGDKRENLDEFQRCYLSDEYKYFGTNIFPKEDIVAKIKIIEKIK